MKPLILPPYGKKYYSGLYRVDGMYQYTTRGLGTSTFAVRLNCPPEISVHTLRSPSVEEG
jgi:predicted MPP superfamily phosphohydrolase